MNNLMTTRNKLIGAVALAVLVIGGGVSSISSSGKKAAKGYYNELKEQFFLDAALSEGDIGYSIFSGNLTIESPEVRALPAQTREAQTLFSSLMSLAGGSGRNNSEEGLTAWSYYQISSAAGKTSGAILAKADALQIGRSGDKESGEIRIKVKGLDMSNPYVSEKAGSMVLVADVGDVVQPRAELQASDRVAEGDYLWLNNMASQARFNGGWLVNSTGLFGTKVDMDLVISRDSDGEGELSFVVTHKNDGSKVGTITRRVKFESMPDLDAITGLGRSAAGAFMVGAMSNRTGATMLAQALTGFLAKAKVKSYSLSYDGFDQLGDNYKAFKAATGQEDYAAYCKAFDLGTADFMSRTKAKHDDSECAIAQKLIAKGEYEESFTFDETKSLFADVFVSNKFEFETN